MAFRAFRLRHSLANLSTISLKPFSSSSRAVLAARHLSSSSFSSASNTFCGRSSSLSGCRVSWPLSRHMTARWRSWETLADCKNWLVVFEFPNDPKPTRDEMIDTYVKTLANVLGSVDEAKKRIFAVCTTTYSGFQCTVDEATSEKLNHQPLVSWVLPNGHGTPENGDFVGDRYNNGVITPDPNPRMPTNERSRNFNRTPNERLRNRQRKYDNVSQRDFKPMEGRETVKERIAKYTAENMQGDSLQGQDDYRSSESRD